MLQWRMGSTLAVEAIPLSLLTSECSAGHGFAPRIANSLCCGRVSAFLHHLEPGLSMEDVGKLLWCMDLTTFHP